MTTWKTENIEIRSLCEVKELEEVRALEAKIWGLDDSIPIHQTLTAVKNGGLVLGAYHNGDLIGFQYSFPGFNGNSIYLCSHVLATVPAFRNKGVGEKLKLVQKEEALKLGYNVITWTYDPLESVNGYLNIGKLGGSCSTYIPNCYGEMEDLLNKGIPSDRFLVRWHIGEQPSLDNFRNEMSVYLISEYSLLQWEVNGEGDPIITYVQSIPEDQRKNVLVPIPKNFRRIRERSLDAAVDWRMKTRDIFTNLFQQGWQVTGFIKNTNLDSPVNFYVLTVI